jgi:hypothetical protein
MLRRVLTCVGVLCVVGGSAAMADDRWERPRPPQSLIDARIKIFGPENVDRKSGALPRHQVVMSWLTHTTMAVSIRGRVILLDTFIRRLETEPGRTPFVIQDVVDLKPEAIFIGHGHGDHADDAAFIAAKTGAAL